MRLPRQIFLRSRALFRLVIGGGLRRRGVAEKPKDSGQEEVHTCHRGALRRSRQGFFVLPLAAFFGGLGLASAADIVPTERRFNWQAGTNVGVPGGFWQYRSRTVVNVTGLDNTGATDVSSALRAWIDGAADDVCLLLPAGEFKIAGEINIALKSDNSARKRITLRGAGMGQTILKTYTGGSVKISSVNGGGGPWPTNYPSSAYIASEVAAGATTMTVPGHECGEGLLINIEGLADPVIPAWTFGEAQVRSTLLLCTGVSGDTVSFLPALPFRLPAGGRFTREVGTGAPYYTLHAYRCGIEDLTVEKATSGGGMVMQGARECWLYNVEVDGFDNYGNGGSGLMYCTFQHCVVRDQVDAYPAVSSRNGWLISFSTGILFADNLIFNTVSAMEINSGVTMSAFVYNMADRISVRDTVGSAFNINHGGHNSFNLYEGNILPRIQPDGYFGSSSFETIARNWIHGSNGVYTTDWSPWGGDVIYNRLPVTLNRFTRKFNVVGNLLGRTDQGITWEYANAGVQFAGTSTTSINLTGIIGTQPTFTTQTGLGYNNNGTVAILYSAADPTKWVLGSVRDYNSGTGTFYLETVQRANGSGTVNDWVMIGGSGYGNDLIYALGGPDIGAGGLHFRYGGIVAPQTLGIWWPNWDGRTFTQRGAYNGATTYNQSGSGIGGTADTVSYTANTSYIYGGNGVTRWSANNPAKAGTATWDTPGPDSVDWVPHGQNVYKELDWDVYGTGLYKGNWTAFAGGGIHSSEALGGDTVATSYLYTSKPGFLGSASGADRNWPVFDSASPNRSFTANGAGYRYNFFKTNGTWDGSEPAGYSADDSGGGAPTPPTHTPSKLRTLRRR